MSIAYLNLAATAPDERTADCASAGRWFTRIAVMTPTGEPRQVERRTGESEESGLLVLTGTHDLFAGGGSWISRGTRAVPHDGKPVAIYLPPKTSFGVRSGDGDLLVIAARQPAANPSPSPAAEPPRKALLPLAGSGKAFDSSSGSWQPVESFPDSPEAILPRRIEVIETGAGVRTAEVFPLSYKTRGLTLWEIVLPAEQTVQLPPAAAGESYPEEWATYYRAEGTLRVTDATGAQRELSGDGALIGHGTASLCAQSGRVYLAVAGAGPKPAQT